MAFVNSGLSTEEAIAVKILSSLDRKGFDEAIKVSKVLYKELKHVGLVEFDAVTNKIGKLGEGGKKVAANMKVMQAETKDAAKQAKRFKMEYLGIMFAGMAMQRTFGKALKSMVAGYKKAFEGSSDLTKVTNKLTGAWEYLKFSFINALVQNDAFKWLIDKLTVVVDWFNNLSDSAKVGVVTALAALYLLGSGFALIGQIVLGWTSIAKALKIGQAVDGIDDVKTGISGTQKLLAGGLMLGIGLTIAGIAIAGDDPATIGETITSMITGGLGTGWVIAGLGGSAAAALAGGVLAAATLAILLEIDKEKKDRRLKVIN